MLVLSLAAYPTCASYHAQISCGPLYPFIWMTGIIALLGTLATGAALWQQWTGAQFKPFVFGFDAAEPVFFWDLWAFLSSRWSPPAGRAMQHTFLLSSLIFLPMSTASLVRFTFIALACALCMAAILSEPKQRKHLRRYHA